MTEPTPSGASTTRKPRWYTPTPAKFLFAVLLMQGVLFLSAHYRWFWFNEQKGYTVLITVAATAMALVVLVATVLMSRFFKSKSQFSLATLLLIIPVMAIPCAWLAREMELASQQREALKWINDGRGYGHLSRIVIAVGPPGTRKQPHGVDLFDFVEDQLSPLLGEDFFDDVDAISVSKPDALERVRLLPQLKYLICRDPIEIDLAHLCGLNHLQTLDLNHCQIVGSRLAPLRKLPALQTLSLIGANFTDDDLEVLSHLERLKVLRLGLTAVTDTGLEHVAELDQLTMLHLHRTQITDSGLEHLKGLTHLDSLNLSGTKVTDAGVNSLQNALPNCEIRR